MHRPRARLISFAWLVTLGIAAGAGATDADETIVVASTTSTQDSGLFDYLLPIFRAATGITVHVVAQGSGQALDTGRRGDADVVFVHDKAEELKFVAEGHGVKRYPVMYNDFVLVGPRSDPAGVARLHDITTALQAIRGKRVSFVSRGDRSGTHAAEMALWKDAGVDIGAERETWYKSIGQGMGAALNFAAATNAYVLSDRGTWLRFANKGDLQIVVEGDPRLFNQYGVILVNPKTHPNVKRALGQRFIDYLVSPEGQRDIAAYKIGGQQLFYPDAESERQAVVAARASRVMPFQLSQTIHVFSKTDDGAIQKVIVRDPKNRGQLSLVRAHLAEIATAFAHGDYSGPTEIHGAAMPGLAALKDARPGDIQVAYEDIPDGGQITYKASAIRCVEALHQWVDAQLSDHGHDATEGHDHHSDRLM